MIGSNPYKRSIIIDDVTVEVNPRNRLSLIRSDTLKREREREKVDKSGKYTYMERERKEREEKRKIEPSPSNHVHVHTHAVLFPSEVPLGISK